MTFFLTFLFFLSTPLSSLENRPILGYTELISLDNNYYTALIDSGAALSSLHCSSYRIKNTLKGESVSFVFDHPKNSHPKIIEAPLSRYILVRQANTKGAKRRPVIRLTLSVKGVSRYAEFSLVDRSHMTYPIILGRNFLGNYFYIDPSIGDDTP